MRETTQDNQEYLSGRAEDQPKLLEHLANKKILMFLAQGFDDAEAVTVLDVFGWTAYRSSLASVAVETCALHKSVSGAFGTSFVVDVSVPDVNVSAYDALVIPGGFYNLGFDEAYEDEIQNLARSFYAAEKPIATMCVGVLPVAAAGLLKGGKATTYAFSSRHDNLGFLREHGCEAVNAPVVQSKNVISCSGPAYSLDVAMALLERLVGTDAAAELRRYRAGCDL